MQGKIHSYMISVRAEVNIFKPNQSEWCIGGRDLLEQKRNRRVQLANAAGV